MEVSGARRLRVGRKRENHRGEVEAEGKTNKRDLRVEGGGGGEGGLLRHKTLLVLWN